MFILGNKVTYVSAIGGGTVKAAVDRILKTLVTRNLALSFSLTGKASKGKAGKQSFKNTGLVEIIFGEFTILSFNHSQEVTIT